MESGCPRNLKVTGPAALVSTDCGHRISTCFPHGELSHSLRNWEFLERATERIFRLAVPGSSAGFDASLFWHEQDRKILG